MRGSSFATDPRELQPYLPRRFARAYLVTFARAIGLRDLSFQVKLDGIGWKIGGERLWEPTLSLAAQCRLSSDACLPSVFRTRCV